MRMMLSKDIVEKNSEVTGTYPGPTTLRDVPDAKLKGGKFMVFDGMANEVLELDLLKIHMDRLTGIGNDTYFACADFQASNGKVYDLDIFMKGIIPDNLDVSEIIVHKEEGVPRYSWREEKGIWVQVK